MDIKPIETKYKGYKFRSRLEARWAVFFDAVGIEWEYETEGYQFDDGTKYLPDFYLPESKQFFEVKGIMTETDMQKIKKLISCGKDVAIGYSDYTFQACSAYFDDDKLTDVFYLDDKDMSELCCCPSCHKHFFLGIGGTWNCRCQDMYIGDGREVCADGELDYVDKKIQRAIAAAKQARFEHGEKP
jgi:hypothetical protein